MRIRTQFFITMVLFGVILVVIAASAIITHRMIEKTNEQEALARRITLGAGELSYLSNDYLIYRESQQLKRWESGFAALSNHVANLRVDKPEQQVLVRNIRANEERLKQVFDSVASAVQGPSPKRSATLDLAFLQVSWSRMAVQSQGLVSDASRLSQLLHQQMDQLTEIRTVLMYVIVGFFGALLLVSYMLTYRRILKSIAILQAGITVIGSGNLDFTVEEKKNDEIGDLSCAFNRMAVNLKAVTASKTDLEREVTERKRAEEELRRQREWLRVTLSSIGDAVIASDTEGRITFLNPEAVTLTGWRAEEALGQPIGSVFRIINEKTRQPAEDLVRQVLGEKRIVALANDTALVAKDGREIPIEDSAAPIKDGSGNLIGVVLVFHDVSEKRRADAALREAHERAVWLARFPEENPNPVLRISADGIILYCNPATSEFRGWTCEVGQTLQKELLPLVGRAMDGGRETQEDIQLGGRFYIIWVVPFPGEGYANVYGRDVTPRKLAEEAVHESEDRLRFALETSHTGAWDLDLVDHSAFRSLEHDRIFGYAELLPQWTYEMFLKHVLPEDRDTVNAKFQRAVDTQSNWSFECRIRRSDGQIRWIWAAGRHRCDAGSPRRRIAGIVQDITDRKQAEEALRQRTLELQQLTETLEQRVQVRTEELKLINQELKVQIDECARVENELKKSENDLRRLSIELLSAQEKERKTVAGEIHDSIGSSLSAIKFKVETAFTAVGDRSPEAAVALKSVIPVVQGAIDEARRIQMNLRPSILDDLGILATVRWFCRQFESTYSDIHISQSINIEEHEVPDSLKTVIFRVLQESLNNVAKHSKSNVVLLSFWKTDRTVKLMIQDDGQGFELSQLQPRNDTVRGLGLKNMRERAELSGGSLVIESTRGKGTVIRASWPI